MSNALMTYPTQDNTPSINWQSEQVRKTFGGGANEQEWEMFVGLAKATNLNPYTREIWLAPYENKKSGRRDTLIMVGFAGLMRIANEHPQFDGMECEITPDPKDKRLPYSGKCRVFRKDRTRAVEVELFFHETKRPDSGYGRWSTAPFSQFTKCLKAAALREAFPVVSGSYIPEEMGVVNGKLVDVTPESPTERMGRRLEDWSQANQPVEPLKAEQVEAVVQQEAEQQQETPASSKAVYRYNIAQVDEDKLDSVLKYLEKEGATEVSGSGLTTWESLAPLPKLAKYEVD